MSYPYTYATWRGRETAASFRRRCDEMDVIEGPRSIQGVDLSTSTGRMVAHMEAIREVYAHAAEREHATGRRR